MKACSGRGDGQCRRSEPDASKSFSRCCTTQHPSTHAAPLTSELHVQLHHLRAAADNVGGGRGCGGGRGRLGGGGHAVIAEKALNRRPGRDAQGLKGAGRVQGRMCYCAAKGGGTPCCHGLLLALTCNHLPTATPTWPMDRVLVAVRPVLTEVRSLTVRVKFIAIEYRESPGCSGRVGRGVVRLGSTAGGSRSGSRGVRQGSAQASTLKIHAHSQRRCNSCRAAGLPACRGRCRRRAAGAAAGRRK